MHLIKPHINEKLLHYFYNKELDELYISVALKSLAESFVGIFVPIYLLTLGFDIRLLVIYYAIYFLSIVFFMILGMKLNSSIGVKKTMSLWILFFVIYFLSLHSFGITMPYIIALIWWAAVALYYASFHIEFSKFTAKNKEATQFSILKIITIVASIVWPLLGALFIEKISFNFLFILVSVLMLLSIVPLFFTKDIKTEKFNFSFSKLKKSDSLNKFLVYNIDGVLNLVSGIFWPVFIFITLKEVFALWVIVSATSMIMVIFLIIIARLTDKNRDNVFKIWIWSYSVSWITRLLFLSPIGIFLNNIYSSLASLMIEIPFSKMIYQKSKKTVDISHYFLFREIGLAAGRIILLVVVFFVNDIYWAFIIAFFMTFAYFLIMRKK